MAKMILGDDFNQIAESMIQGISFFIPGFEEKQDSFEKEALGILQEIKDDTVREMLLKQMRALL